MSESKYTVKEAKAEVQNTIKAYLLKDDSGKNIFAAANRMPIYLYGAPGIGKTQIVQQVANELGIGFCSFSVTHYTRSSLLGLPVIKDLEGGGKYTEYTMSELIAKPMQEYEKGYKQGILLIDEFNCAAETIFPSMLAFLQTRNIGPYTLPEDWMIVLCGNPPEYNASARDFSPAILDRVRKIDILTDVQSFMEYAKAQNFHPIVQNFIAENYDSIYEVSGRGDKAQVVTYRGWENLSRTLYAYEKLGVEISDRTVEQFIKSGQLAKDFEKYYWMCKNCVSPEEIQKILKFENVLDKAHEYNKKGYSFCQSVLKLMEGAILKKVGDESAKQDSEKDYERI